MSDIDESAMVEYDRSEVTKLRSLNASLISEAARLRAEHDDLKAENERLREAHREMVFELDVAKHARPVILDQVEAFMKAFGQPVGARIGVPDEKTVRLAARLVIEEALEFFGACFVGDDSELSEIRAHLFAIARRDAVHVNFTEAIDALADVKYVNHWAYLAFGVQNDQPIADEVQRANMAKATGPVDPVTGKKLKPPGWTPPDISGALRSMGWDGYKS